MATATSAIGCSDRQDSVDKVGLLLALAYPDRIAQRQRGIDARYLMANGRGALFETPIHSAQKTIWSLQTWMVANNGLGLIEQLL